MLIEAFAAGAGATGALLLVGGTIALRWQRNAQQFELAKSALDQGVAPPVDPLPAWLVSSRTGAMRVGVGVGLIVAGGLAWVAGSHVPLPQPGPGMAAAFALMQEHGHGAEMPGQPPVPPGLPPVPPDQAGPRADHPPGDGPGVSGAGPGVGGPGAGPASPGPAGPGDRPPRPDDDRPDRPGDDRPGDAGPGPGRPPRPPEGQAPLPPGPALPPPPPDPETLRWIHAQGQMHLGQLAMAVGLIVAMTGFVRVLFARFERRHALAVAKTTLPATTVAVTPPTP